MPPSGLVLMRRTTPSSADRIGVPRGDRMSTARCIRPPSRGSSNVFSILLTGAPVSSIENTFDDPRDGGRMHRAVDILSPRGTPILSADDGVVLRMSTSPLGGICLYAADPDHRLVYYYAHMDRYHDSMISGRRLAKGDTIGFVGTTGNAPKNVPHLHFQVRPWPADGKYWNGEPINPYSALVGAERATVRVTGSP